LPFVKLPDDISSQNAILVRVGQKYSKAELPLQDLDAAVAGELVFSVWVRRRDVHSFNRVYNSDHIPVFFDLHAALNGLEGEDFRAIAKFFPDNRGVASAWRVKETTIQPTTLMYRRDQTPNDTHDIYDVGKFKQAALTIAERIISDQRNLKILVETAGFTGADVDYLVTYLEETKSTLREDVNKMLKVVLS
jgi:hypothetical protein